MIASKGFGKVQSVEMGGNARTIYSSNPGVQATIESLLVLGCPPIPVAPKQDPRAEGCHHQQFAIVRFKEANPNQPEIQGDYCRISQTKIGASVAPVKGDYCRLEEALQPIGRFTGKNPSYLDRNGRAKSLNHRAYQNRQPNERELREWFRNSQTGVGTLGGHSGVVWLDFDAKNYSSQEDCDRDVQRIISAHNLETAWIERTGSGGWRIAVRPQTQPTFTNFSTTIDGDHIGEALWEGRFTVLAPTIHPNGNSYRRIGWSSPAEVESLEAIGIYPTKDEIANQSRKQKRSGQSANQSAPTDPIANPWDIRNFADRLVGYRIEGDWINCKCPAHNGVSDNSLHIRLDTGAYKCWSGCDTKRVQQEALLIAVASGYKLPETETQAQYEKPDRDAYQAHAEAERDRVEQSQERERTQQHGGADDRRREKWRTETERIQQELNGISIEPTLSVCGEFITRELIKLPEKRGIIVIQAPTKSGKSSTALKALRDQYYKRHGVHGHISAWVPRRKLGSQLGIDLGLPLHQDGRTNHFTACVESIGVCNPSDWTDDPAIVFFDEPSMTFKQILEGQTTKDKQAFVLDRLRGNLKAVADRGGWIVLSEDTVTNLELDFIRTASGLEVVEFIDFHKKPESREIQLYDRTAEVWAETKQRLEDGQNIIQGSDVRRELERVRKLVLSLDILEDKVFLFTSQTSHEPYFDEFVGDRAAFIEKYKPRYVGFSPSIGTGVSIDDPNGHFDAMAFHLTRLEPRESIQISERLRTNAPRYGFVSESAFEDDDLHSSSRPDVIKRDLFRNRDGVANVTRFAAYVAEKASVMGTQGEDYQTSILAEISRLDSEKDDINTTFGWYLDFYCKYKARGNYNKGRLREGLIERWEAKGYSVSFVDTAPNKEMSDLRKQIRKDLEQSEADNFAQCDVSEVSLAEAVEILRSNNQTTPEQRLKARKRILEDKLPGCPLNDAEFVKRVIVEHHGKFLKSTELLWMTRNPDIANHLDRWNWDNQFSKAGQSGKFVILHKLSIRSGQAKLLNECPLHPFILGEIEYYSNDSPEAISVKDWALLHARQFKRYLRLNVKEEQSPVKVVNKILRKLGFDPKSIKRPGGEGSRDRVWAIADEQADIDRELIIESLNLRFNEKRQEKQQEMQSWATLSETVADMLSMIRIAIECGTVFEVMQIFATLPERERKEVWSRLTDQEKAILHRSRAAA